MVPFVDYHANCTNIGIPRKSCLRQGKGGKGGCLTLSFSPYARMMAIESHDDILEEEKRNSWWQKEDYDSFRAATNQVVKSMLHENINGWLGVKDEEPENDHPPNATSPQANTYLGINPLPKRQLSPTRKISDENIEQVNQKPKLLTMNQDDNEAESCWNRYGEFACFHEARRRQANVKKSIQVVLKEQRRQRFLRCFDTTRIQKRSQEATAWSCKWAVALALAVAEEVKGEFKKNSIEQETLKTIYTVKQSFKPLVDRPRRPVVVTAASQAQYREELATKMQQVAPLQCDIELQISR